MNEKTNNEDGHTKKTAWQILSEVATETLELSTIHGFTHYINSKFRTVRIMWIIVGIASFGYCIYLLTMAFIGYFSFNVTVSISNYQDLPATFPAITFCNINPFYDYYAYPYILNKTNEAACFSLANGDAFQACLNKTTSNGAFDNFLNKMKRIIANDKNLTDSDRFVYGYSLNNNLLLSCSFNGIQCDHTNFSKYWSNLYGNCYTFNDGSLNTNLLKTSATGDQYGLSLELAVGMFLLNFLF